MKREHHNLALKVGEAKGASAIAEASAAFGAALGHPAPVTVETDAGLSHVAAPDFGDAELRKRRPDLFD